MPRLVSRLKSIPNGFVFYQPQTGWKAPRFASFSQVVAALIAHRKGNPFITRKFNLATDVPTVEEEVDEFNANVCLRMGWGSYVAQAAAGGQPDIAPFRLPLPQGGLIVRAGKLAAGGKAIVEWIESGDQAVPALQASQRATVCATCPLNERGDWTRWFTVPASEAIREALRQRRDWNLSTPFDSELKVCTACWCPLPLKVHMPIERITKVIDEESKARLHPDCWIRKESGQ